jgi:hypothetical protein
MTTQTEAQRLEAEVQALRGAVPAVPDWSKMYAAPAAPQPAAQQEPAPGRCKLCNGSGVGNSGVHSLCICQYGGAAPQPAAQQEPAGEPVNVYCETCEGSGSVYQEQQRGCHVGGHYDCPDCDGKGYNIRHTRPAVPLTDDPLPSGVMFAVEQAIKNGNCPWEIEVAYEEYERELQAAHNIGGAE